MYEILRRPRVTTKAYDLNRDHQQLVIDVHPAANKPMIAEALFKLFGAKVEKIRIVVRKGKVRRAGRRSVVVGKTTKKAIVTLVPGQSVNMDVATPATESSARAPQSQGN